MSGQGSAYKDARAKLDSKVTKENLEKQQVKFGLAYATRQRLEEARIARAELIAGAGGAVNSSAAQGALSSIGTSVASSVGNVQQRLDFAKGIKEQVDIYNEANRPSRTERAVGTAVQYGSAVYNFVA